MLVGCKKPHVMDFPSWLGMMLVLGATFQVCAAHIVLHPNVNRKLRPMSAKARSCLTANILPTREEERKRRRQGGGTALPENLLRVCLERRVLGLLHRQLRCLQVLRLEGCIGMATTFLEGLTSCTALHTLSLRGSAPGAARGSLIPGAHFGSVVDGRRRHTRFSAGIVPC